MLLQLLFGPSSEKTSYIVSSNRGLNGSARLCEELRDPQIDLCRADPRLADAHLRRGRNRVSDTLRSEWVQQTGTA